MGPHADTVKAGEVALVEVSPGRVLAFARNSTGYFAEMWSDDGGTPSMLQGAPEAVDLEELRLSRKVFQEEVQRTVARANYPL